MSGMDSEPVPEGTVAGVPVAEGTAPRMPRKAPRARRTRGIVAWVLVVLASLLIPVSVISVWAIRTVTNTDQYVATLAPLARDPVIVDYLAAKATDKLFSTHIVQDKVTAALPKAAKPIVTPIVNEVHNYVYGLALQVFESPKFGQLWDTLNRHTHDAVIDVLTGKQTPLTQKLEKGGAIVVNVTPALNTLIDKANAKGVTLFNPLKAILTQGNNLGVTVVSKSQVSKFTGLFNLIVKLKWVIPVVALVLAALGIGIAVQRRKTLLRMAIGVGAGHPASARRPLLRADHVHQPCLGTPQRAGRRRCVGHHAALPQDRPALDAACHGARRPRCLAGRARSLRRVDPLDGRQGGPLGRHRGPRTLLGGGAGRRRIGPGPPHRRMDHRASQRPPCPWCRCRGPLPRLRREPHRVEPADHRHRAGRVPGAVAADRRLGPQGCGLRGGPRRELVLEVQRLTFRASPVVMGGC